MFLICFVETNEYRNINMLKFSYYIACIVRGDWDIGVVKMDCDGWGWGASEYGRWIGGSMCLQKVGLFIVR